MTKNNGTLIEMYLNGELSQEDITKVENLLKTDAEFAREFYLRKDINEVLQNKKYLKVYKMFKGMFKAKTRKKKK